VRIDLLIRLLEIAELGFQLALVLATATDLVIPDLDLVLELL